jgi:hypothetical protein
MSDLPGIILLVLRFGLAICLYLFLFWAIRILWRDLKSTVLVQPVPPPPIHLSFPEDLGFEKPVTLSQPENLLGRAPECTLILNNSTVSSIHARIFHTQAQWWVEDMNSSNGTYLNGNQVHQPAVLTSEDLLGFGSVEVSLTIPNLDLERKQDELKIGD